MILARLIAPVNSVTDPPARRGVSDKSDESGHSGTSRGLAESRKVEEGGESGESDDPWVILDLLRTWGA